MVTSDEVLFNVGAEKALPVLRIDEPTLKMTFMTNDSPFVGRDGEFVTARKIEERLYRETQKDVSLKVEPYTNESFLVSGRGELHLGILIENMRREGFEFAVSKAEVLYKKDENGEIIWKCIAYDSGLGWQIVAEENSKK